MAGLDFLDFPGRPFRRHEMDDEKGRFRIYPIADMFPFGLVNIFFGITILYENQMNPIFGRTV